MRTILVAGSIALGAEDRWMKTREGELRKRFPSFFAYAQRHSPQRVGWDQVRQAVEAHGSWTDPVRSGALGCLRELASARRSHPPLIRPSDGTVFLPMGRDGFFAALWALNDATSISRRCRSGRRRSSSVNISERIRTGKIPPAR